MVSAGASKFSATDSTLGYLYQLRTGLLWSLRRLKHDSAFLVSIETLDDVTFESVSGVASDLLQTKLHKNKETTITDASVDLWKTLRIWIEGRVDGSIPSTARLQLLTTATAPPNTIAHCLTAEHRNVDAALQSMGVTAQTSTNKENAAAYQAFLRLTQSERRDLVDAIIILDKAPASSTLDDDLRREVFWAVERQHQEVFLQRLEGWWLRRTIKQLQSGPSNDRISAAELETQMSDLREQFKREALPIDDDLLNYALDEATHAKHEGSHFVRQLECIEATKRRIALAVQDYYRAYEQRSRWLRNSLLSLGEVQRYEGRLVREWELAFEGMKNEIGAAATEDEMRKAGRDVLSWAERANLSMRDSVTEPFVCRGSFHVLADDLRLGWHPEFKDRIQALLAPKEDVA
jgi:hypothetical protein